MPEKSINLIKEGEYFMHEHHNHNHDNIKLAFFLNLGFSIFELIGGLFTNSVAIFSDAIHDFGDSLAIGISYFLEKLSHKKADKKLTYGYKRYSILGAFFTSTILLFGSCIVVFNATGRILNPVEVHFTGMLLFSIFGIIINGYAAYKTSKSINLNEKSVNLHMLEDVLGWIAVLVGSLLIKITGLSVIDPLLSIAISLVIGIKAVKSVLEALNVMVESVPSNIDLDALVEQVKLVSEVCDVHHVHVWSLDEESIFLTMHVQVGKNVTKKNYEMVKKAIKEKLKEAGIAHSTIEIEYNLCDFKKCE